MTTQIPVRHPRLDFANGFDLHWLGGDAFRTQLFNAFSMSFPIGEKYFIDTVHETMPLIDDAQLTANIKSFIGQESVHSQLHRRFNAVLSDQGMHNVIEKLAGWRVRHGEGFSLHSRLAIVMAYEHFTAVFGDALLRDKGWIDGADEEMRLLWTWHALEETEHKAVAFDCYAALGNGYLRRIAWYLYISVILGADVALQTLLNLYTTRRLLQLSTWRNGLRFFFGRRGVLAHTVPHWFAYLRPAFHPDDNDINHLADKWLAQNTVHFR
jgi:uncharacterized protein